MSTRCIFELNNPNGVYYSGQQISGAISLNTVKNKNVRNVRIVFLGEAKVKWSESTSTTNADGSTSTHTTYYTSHKVYVHNETVVHGEGQLPMGLHTYTFNIALPFECPTSCEGKYGHIRYGISLILDRPLRFDNVFQKPLTILQNVDLNAYPSFKVPIAAQEIGNACCWSCSSKKFIYTLRVPFGAYAPGQVVKYELRIENQTMTDTQGYDMEFSQRQTFIAHSPSHKERHKKYVLVNQNFREPCLRLSNRQFEGQFRIPSVPSSTTSYDSIIKNEYMLKVTVRVPCCTSDTKLKIPIFIGNVPIRESLPTVHIRQDPAAEAGATAPELEDKVKEDLPPNYDDMKPPSYVQATRSDSPVFEDKDIDERHRNVGFRPLYPMYS